MKDQPSSREWSKKCDWYSWALYWTFCVLGISVAIYALFWL